MGTPRSSMLPRMTVGRGTSSCTTTATSAVTAMGSLETAPNLSEPLGVVAAILAMT